MQFATLLIATAAAIFDAPLTVSVMTPVLPVRPTSPPATRPPTPPIRPTYTMPTTIRPPPPPLPPPPQPPRPLLPDTGTLALPSGAELIVGSIVEGFSCAGLGYGYYADTANDCRIFHVCVPTVRSNGDGDGDDFYDFRARNPLTYSFFCGNQTVFDQEQLICTHVHSALPCEQALNYYSVNEKFGKTED